jgi:integrase
MTSPSILPGEHRPRDIVRRIIRDLRSDTSGAARRMWADRLRARSAAPRAFGPRITDLNHILLSWAGDLLAQPHRYRQNTVCTFLSRVLRAQEANPEASLEIFATSNSLLRFVQAALRAGTTLDARRTMRTALRNFLSFLRDEGYPVAPLSWNRRALIIPYSARITPLLSPSDIRAAIDLLLAPGFPDGHALAVAILLGAFGGLRLGEVCGLQLPDVSRDLRWSVHIRRAKTAWGRRVAAIGLATPPWALEVLDRYAFIREAQHSRNAEWLLTSTGTPWRPGVLGNRIGTLLKRVSHQDVSFHSLRRACATWLFLAWVAGSHGMPVPRALAMDGPSPHGVRALLGEAPEHMLWSLARFLGHASPAVTLRHYVLAVDSFEAEWFNTMSSSRLSATAAAMLLTVSSRRARQLFSNKREVSLETVLEEQRRRLAARPVPCRQHVAGG